MATFTQGAVYDSINELQKVQSRLKNAMPETVREQWRNKLLDTPQGQAIYQSVDSILLEEQQRQQAVLDEARHQLVNLVSDNGAPPELAAHLDAYLSGSKPQVIQSADELFTALSDYLPIENTTPSGTLASAADKVAQWLAQYGKNPAPTITVSSDGQSKPAPQRPDILVPDARSSQEHIAQYDQAAADYGDSLSVTLDQSDGDNYSSLATYLNNTKESPCLTKDNATPTDYAIISNLTYARKFNNSEDYRLAAGREGLTVKQYCDWLLAADSMADGTGMSDRDKAFLLSLRNNNRYNQLKLDHVDYADVGALNTNIVVLSGGNGHAFIGIEGTNGTNPDWINDAYFATSELTTEEAYINGRINRYVRDYTSFDITGHSQGGRDAITASAFLDDENKSKLNVIYNMDGPGYSRGFLNQYGDRYTDIVDNLYNVYPDQSFVGHFLISPGGTVTYVDTSDFPGGIMNTHGMEAWALDEKGNFVVLPDGLAIPKFTREISQWISETIPEESLKDTLASILRIASSDDDPNQIDFSKIFANRNELTFSEKEEILGTLVVLGCDFFEKAAPIVLEYLDKADKIISVLSTFAPLLPPDWQLAIKVLDKVITITKYVVKALDFLAKAIGSFVKKWLQKRAEERRLARARYAAEHPYFFMSYQHLENAKEYMQAANAAIRKADAECNNLWNCFSQEEKQVEKTWIDGILNTVTKIVPIPLSISQASRFFRKSALKVIASAVLDAIFVKENVHCTKGIKAVDLVIAQAQNINSCVGLRCDRQDFGVAPGTLSAGAKDGADAMEDLLKTLKEGCQEIYSTSSHWEADDFSSLKDAAEKFESDAEEVINGLASCYNDLIKLSSIYEQLQAFSIETFQNAGENKGG